jgi:CubicO group peptidase (beta-lactamase class C family)
VEKSAGALSSRVWAQQDGLARDSHTLALISNGAALPMNACLLRDSLIICFLVVASHPMALGLSPDFSAVDAHLNLNLAEFSPTPGQPALYVEVRREGTPIYTYQAGSIGRETVVGFASATKLVSAGVILALAERPEWGLDVPMGNTVLLMNSHGKGALTPYHAFTMTAGLCSDPTLGDTCPAYEILPFYTLEQSAFQIITNYPVHHPPMTVMSYDGAGMQLAGYTATRVFNTPWQELAEETLFDPLGMNATSYTRFAPNPAIAGGLETNAADYLLYLDMLLNGGEHEGVRLLTEDSIDVLWINHTQGLPITNSPWNNKEGLDLPYGVEGPPYGFGCWVLAQEPVSGVVEEICSPGAFGTFPWMDRKRGLTGILVTEMPTGTREWVVETHMIQLIREAIDNAVRTDYLLVE